MQQVAESYQSTLCRREVGLHALDHVRALIFVLFPPPELNTDPCEGAFSAVCSHNRHFALRFEADAVGLNPFDLRQSTSILIGSCSCIRRQPVRVGWLARTSLGLKST